MAVTFSGTTPTYLSTTSVPASQTLKGSAWTMSIWVNCSGSGGNLVDGAAGDSGVYMGIAGSGTNGSAFTDIVSLQNSASNGTFFQDLSQSSQTQELFIQGNSTTTTVWRHYAATYDGSNTTGGCKIYQNGAAVTPTTTGGSLTSTVSWNRIIVGGFNGAAQDAWLFNRVLTAAEIAALYNGGREVGLSYSNLVGYWPMYNGGNAGVDFSGNGRNLTATGTVSDSTLQAPRPWFGRSPTIIIPAASALAITPAGTTQTTGAVTLGELAAITPAGTTQTTGAVTLTALKSLAPAGTTNVTGAVSLTELAALAPAGTTQTTGAVALTAIEALAPAGSTNTTGAVALTSIEALTPAGTTNVTGVVALGLTAPLTPAGTSNTTGAVSLGVSASLGTTAGSSQTTGSVTLGSSANQDLGATTGSTQTSGSVAFTEIAAVAPAGTTQSTGSVALTALESVTPAGTTNATGSVGLGLTAPLAAPSGSTQTTGAVQLGILLQFPALGSTNTIGAVALTELAALAPTGTTSVTGSFAMGAKMALAPGGTTSCFGSVTLGGGIGPTVTGGPFKGNVSRRTMYAGRRRMRVV